MPPGQQIEHRQVGAFQRRGTIVRRGPWGDVVHARHRDDDAALRLRRTPRPAASPPGP
ncbi:hypothetical protein ACU686_00645 [Yinghuangia aomiensis]